jgi:hypothetical protein
VLHGFRGAVRDSGSATVSIPKERRTGELARTLETAGNVEWVTKTRAVTFCWGTSYPVATSQGGTREINALIPCSLCPAESQKHRCLCCYPCKTPFQGENDLERVKNRSGGASWSCPTPLPSQITSDSIPHSGKADNLINLQISVSHFSAWIYV